MYRLGLSSCGKILSEELFASYAKSGLEAIEISLSPESYSSLNYKAIEKFSGKYGVELWTYHLPFAPISEIDPSSLDEKNRKHTVAYFAEMIKKASEIGINKFVVHSSGERIEDDIRKEKILRAKESLNELAEIAEKSGSVICVENLPRACLGNCSDELKDLISVNDKLRVCFDTNHLLKEDSAVFIKNLAHKIVTIHVSDYDFINERHWLPGEGKIDWAEMLKNLKNAGYNGVWMYEIAYECPKTIIRDRDLNANDFAANAKELFAGKTPSVFSSPVENLGFRA